MVLAVRPYVRVSTDEQAEEGYSIAAQRELIEAYCKSSRWAIADWYVEEGVSAKDTRRPELSRLRQDLRAGEVVVVYRLDRLTRDIGDLHTLLREWNKRDIGFASVTEKFDTTSASGELLMNVLASVAQWERKNLAERVRMGMNKMVKDGKWYGGVTAPYGYDVVDRRLVPNEREAAILVEIYRRYISGQGLRTIVIWLDQELGLRTKQGARWSPFTLHHILGKQREVYLGSLVWNKAGKGDPVIVPGAHEPLITPEMAAAVEAIKERHQQLHPREIASKFALTGIACCGLCGARVSGQTQPQYDRKTRQARWWTRHYMCQERKRRKGCTLPQWRAAKLEAEVLEQITNLADPLTLRRHTVAESTRDLAAERRQLEEEAARIKAAKRRWYDAFEAGLPAGDVKERLAELATRESGIQARLTELSRQPQMTTNDLVRLLRDFPTAWQMATVEEQKEMLAELFESVTVYPDRVEVQLRQLDLT